MATPLRPLCWGESSGVLHCKHLGRRLGQQLCGSDVLSLRGHMEGRLLQVVRDSMALLWGGFQEDLQTVDLRASGSHVQCCVPLLVLHMSDALLEVALAHLIQQTRRCNVTRSMVLHKAQILRIFLHNNRCWQYLYVMYWLANQSKEGWVSLFRRGFHSGFLRLCSSQQQGHQVCMAACSCPVQSEPPMVIPAAQKLPINAIALTRKGRLPASVLTAQGAV